MRAPSMVMGSSSLMQLVWHVSTASVYASGSACADATWTDSTRTSTYYE
jgi:hypothetical protein